MLPNGKEIKPGNTENVEGFGQYVCYQKSATEISMKYNRGCVSNNKLVTLNLVITQGSMKQQCILKGSNYVMQAYGK